MATSLDHLVILAATLPEGVAWCEATFGVALAPGGEHPLMGTHNRLLNISSPAHPRAYLEVIAINPGATPARAAGARRWFDMDNEALQAQLHQTGPQLAHWVAQVPDITRAVAALAAQGIDRGRVLAASRPTPHGLLSWQISVRDDGQRLFGGCLPTLIEWGTTHPCDHLPASGVQLQALQLQHPDATALRAACGAAGLAQVATITDGPAPRLQALLATPRGPLVLNSGA